MTDKHKLVVHFHSANGIYDNRSVWFWLDNCEGEDFPLVQVSSRESQSTIIFSREKSFARVDSANRDVVILGTEAEEVNILIRNDDFTFKTHEYRVRLYQGDNDTHVWIVEGDDTVYYSSQAVLTSTAHAFHDEHAFDMAVRSTEFDKKWGYSGWLGYRYSPLATEFKLWAPTAHTVELVIFENSTNDSPIERVISMVRGENYSPEHHEINDHGVWIAHVDGDLHDKAYMYRLDFTAVNSVGEENANTEEERVIHTSVDPYSRATTAGGERSVILSDEKMRPDDFEVSHGDDASWRVDNPCSAVICEMHIRDFSISPSSGVPRRLRGTYEGACIRGTKNIDGLSTCFDYLEKQGMNYVQLQPVASHYHHYNRVGHLQYNWGYDPTHYNVPEMSYSSNDEDPVSAILELKHMIQEYHNSGIGVILDVVYNHTYSSVTHPFQLTVPDYFYRMNADGSFADGSGCGNETASEKEMCRKYIIDSVMYWAQEFNVDGFRFDLMGLHDVETMNCIRESLDSLDPHILMYGEGWDMGSKLCANDKAKKNNAALMPRIGFFNDNVRDAIKGAEVYGNLKNGFVSHEPTESILAKAVLGSDELNPYDSPRQVLNYIEAHDNFNLNDLLIQLQSDDDELTHIERIELANGLNFVMQGMCFMQLGQEFLRTKLHPTGEDGEITVADTLRAMNSYNAPDAVNRVNWDNISLHRETVDFVRSLITLKTTDDMFAYDSYEQIREHVYVWSAMPDTGILGFDITGDDKRYRIIATTVSIPAHNVLKDFPGSHLVISNNALRIEKESIIDAYTLAIFEKIIE
ncbi:type I pullulanase [Alloscardovia theropitheci]|uniref:1,4-alpha-D-glucan glucanohydrolase n=1 Tax=Alloscardovia theropitheci TaxID=2496842 RepID=A0A4R0QMY3_9BIFI|nr:type I pullulanase [Alloscardovia theropitheci]TCD53533.1 type I pullulanase [Alloscardovia theropitheci]